MKNKENFHKRPIPTFGFYRGLFIAILISAVIYVILFLVFF